MSLPIIETIQTNIENLKNTKQNIKNAVNTDYDFIANEQIESYPGLIKQGIAHYKNRVPHAIKEGTDLSFNGVPLKFDNMTIKGDTSQATKILPEGYTQLDYIKSSGTQYIDTEYKPNNNTKIEVLGQYFKLGTDSNWYTKSFDIAGSPFSFGNTGGNITLTGNKELVIMENGKIKSSTGQRTFNLQSFQCEYNLVLFAIIRNGQIIEKSSACKIYSCKLWENNTLVRDFIPCKNPNNEIGLYDTVSKTFFANQGTGDFVAGNEVTIPNPDYPQPIHVVTGNNIIKMCEERAVELPNGYTQVNYIESTGTQYIDTGFKLNQDTKVEIDYHYVDDGNDKHNYSAFGVNGMFVITSSNTSPMGFKYNETKYNTNISTYVRHKVKFDRNKVYVDDVLIKTFTEATFQADYNATLFARVVNSTGEIEEKTKMRLYSCKIYDNDVLIRDYIPCFRNSDNEIGLYDLVNNTFYMNSGTGSFTYGSIVVKQNYPINLGSIELCKIGDYQDELFKNEPNNPHYDSSLVENGCYKNEIIKKFLFKNDVSEDWHLWREDLHEYQIKTDIQDSRPNGTWISALCDKFKNVSVAGTQMKDNEFSAFSSRLSSEETSIWFRFKKDSIDNLNDFKTFVENNNLLIYAVLDKPVPTQITDPVLISQLDAIDKAKGFNGTTVITSIGEDLAPVLNFTAYLKEVE